eukprot:TRINITY_DN53985_c0_g1_i2.p1 TRINITY_DN53985_c0_g1~~TRINITY_DN53985_c0_g1_i2.p1  ORF type:complete len:559 (-),score=85.61 TRINITY_DN53985_c0_g1_i2:89-1765(-)
MTAMVYSESFSSDFHVAAKNWTDEAGISPTFDADQYSEPLSSDFNVAAKNWKDGACISPTEAPSPLAPSCMYICETHVAVTVHDESELCLWSLLKTVRELAQLEVGVCMVSIWFPGSSSGRAATPGSACALQRVQQALQNLSVFTVGIAKGSLSHTKTQLLLATDMVVSLPGARLLTSPSSQCDAETAQRHRLVDFVLSTSGDLDRLINLLVGMAKEHRQAELLQRGFTKQRVDLVMSKVAQKIQEFELQEKKCFLDEAEFPTPSPRYTRDMTPYPRDGFTCSAQGPGAWSSDPIMNEGFHRRCPTSPSDAQTASPQYGQVCGASHLDAEGDEAATRQASTPWAPSPVTLKSESDSSLFSATCCALKDVDPCSAFENTCKGEDGTSTASRYTSNDGGVCSSPPAMNSGSFSTWASSASAPASTSWADTAWTAPEQGDPDSHQIASCTTYMICNVPCRVTPRQVEDAVNSLGFANKYDYIHLPTGGRSRKNKSNLGYGFINFLNPADGRCFALAFHAYAFEKSTSSKTITVKPSFIQTTRQEAMQCLAKQSVRRCDDDR